MMACSSYLEGVSTKYPHPSPALGEEAYEGICLAEDNEPKLSAEDELPSADKLEWMQRLRDNPLAVACCDGVWLLDKELYEVYDGLGVITCCSKAEESNVPMLLLPKVEVESVERRRIW